MPEIMKNKNIFHKQIKSKHYFRALIMKFNYLNEIDL